MRMLHIAALWVCMSVLVPAGSRLMAFELKSPVFSWGSTIPTVHTCKGKNISPELAWTGAPARTRSFVLICDDPDSSFSWVHWLYYNIPPTITSLPEGIPRTEKPTQGGIQGKNNFRDIGYNGPCPIQGEHRYFFRLYALDTMLDIGPGAYKKDVIGFMKGHVLGKAEIMGKYEKVPSGRD